jgi:AraC-like DNA-binding protein
LSARTLQRRLADTGKTFRGLVEGVRMEEALHLLRTSQLSLHEISECLGYSEPSSFSHAVRSYWGATPRELRRRNASGDGTSHQVFGVP